MATKATKGKDVYSIPDKMVGKTIYHREGSTKITKDLSSKEKAFLVTQGVELIKNDEVTEAAEEATQE